MLRALRRGVLFTVLFAGVVTPAAADPVLMFLLGLARDMIEAQVEKSRNTPPVPEFMPDMTQVYPGTLVEPGHLRRLIDDSFVYLDENQRKEIFDSMHEALSNQKNAAVRGTMINYFAERALAVRAAHARLSQLSWAEKQSLADEFRKEITALPTEDRTQLGELLRSGLLPVPSDLNQLLLATLDAR